MVTAYDKWHRIISPTSSIHAGDQTRYYLLLCLLRDNLYGLIFSIALRFEIWIRKLFYKLLFAYFALGQIEVLNPINQKLVSSDEMTLFCFWCEIPFHLSLIFRKVDQPKVDPEDESLARGEKIIWQSWQWKQWRRNLRSLLIHLIPYQPVRHIFRSKLYSTIEYLLKFIPKFGETS